MHINECCSLFSWISDYHTIEAKTKLALDCHQFHLSFVKKKKKKKMKSLTMMVTTCIVYSILQYFLKLVVRRFTRRGRLTMVEYDDHRNIIQGKSLSKQCFSF